MMDDIKMCDIHIHHIIHILYYINIIDIYAISNMNINIIYIFIYNNNI